MTFDSLIGNAFIKEALTCAVKKKTLSNSLLFSGPSGIGKGCFARALAKLLLCQNDTQGHHAHKLGTGNHPDLRIFKPQGKVGMHSMESLRQLRDEVFQAPYEAPCRVFIVDDAERMLAPSANALLKTFEEPALTSIIILVSESPELLLPTVLSRCQQLRFCPIAPEEIASYLTTHHRTDPEVAAQIAAQSRGSLRQALHLAKEGEQPQHHALLQALATGSFHDYRQMKELLKNLDDSLSQRRSSMEATLEKEEVGSDAKTLSAATRGAITKDVQGLAAMDYLTEVDVILDAILGWYRDLHLLKVEGAPQYLQHHQWQDALKQTLQRGKLPTLEHVQNAVADTRLSVARSMSLSNSLENLFLKLR